MNRLQNTNEHHVLERRTFFKKFGFAGLGLAASAFVLGDGIKLKADDDARPVPPDTAAQIFTGALIAEDLATTFYYQGLIGGAIQDLRLAGPGGTATSVTAGGDQGNVNYLRAALVQEISHANLMRSLVSIPDAAHDPYQIFYFPAGTFDTLTPFLAMLDTLENAFIGAYMTAVQELSLPGVARDDAQGSGYTRSQLAYFAKVAASIGMIEAQHRVLGRDIGGESPANDRNFEQTGGLTGILGGKVSAAMALTPFLSGDFGTGVTTVSFNVADALANMGAVGLNGSDAGANPPDGTIG